MRDVRSPTGDVAQVHSSLRGTWDVLFLVALLHCWDASMSFCLPSQPNLGRTTTLRILGCKGQVHALAEHKLFVRQSTD